jgi:hypothetical protein
VLDGDAQQPHYFFLLLFFFFTFLLFSISLKPYFFSPFFKTLLLFYSLKSLSLDSHCPMFSLISSITPKVLVIRLADTQPQLPTVAAASAASSVAANLASRKPPPKQPINRILPQ